MPPTYPKPALLSASPERRIEATGCEAAQSSAKGLGCHSLVAILDDAGYIREPYDADEHRPVAKPWYTGRRYVLDGQP